MKLEKAKEILNSPDYYWMRKTHPDYYAAQQLAIEALKEVMASREEDYIGDTGLLPGETEE